MKILVKQELYFHGIHHDDTIGSAFVWWITNRNNKCTHFCPICKYYFRCQEDIKMKEDIENVWNRHK